MKRISQLPSLTKIVPLAIGGIFLYREVDEYLNPEREFENRVRLAFKHYEQIGPNRIVKVVSPNQIEYLLKQCNSYGKSIRSVNNLLYSEDHQMNVWVDYSQFNQVKKVYEQKMQCKTEPGITINELNEYLKPNDFYVPYVIPELGDDHRQIQLDQIVQENRLCLQSLKYGFFKDSGTERVSFFSGEGKSVQTGGYKVRDNHQFGFNITDLFTGSYYSLGLLFEVVVNCYKINKGQKGKVFELNLPDSSQLDEIVMNSFRYLSQNEQYVEAIIISNMAQDFQKTIKVTAFDFSKYQDTTIQDYQRYVLPQEIKGERNHQNNIILDIDFVSKFALQSFDKEDSEINVILPITVGNDIMNEFKKDVFLKLPFQIHLLKKQMIMKVCFDSLNLEDIVLIDRFTSQAIKKGGTVKSNRKTLDRISPYIAQRALGNYNIELQAGIKGLFDPLDVLSPSQLFKIREDKAKTWLQKLKESNKQVNYILSK